MRLKSHESPRKMGRNSKGRVASARLRQVKKAQKSLREKLR
jgi:hypothetical protein